MSDHFYIDCEFDGHNGPLLSIALVKDDGRGIHIATTVEASDPWVLANVVPLIDRHECKMAVRCLPDEVGAAIRTFLDCESPVIIADSPVDIARFCRALSTGIDGQWASADYSMMRFEVHNIDCYPTILPNAVQHNAWWDAMALRHAIARVASHPATSTPVVDHETGNMSDKLRPAVEVWWSAWNAWGIHPTCAGDDAVKVIEDDREAVRAEQAAELAKWKALAETLAGALEPFAVEWDKREFLAERHWSFYSGASKALTSYKEQRDAVPVVWSEPSPPNDESSYDHCIASFKFGTLKAEWKSWKDHPGYTVFFEGCNNFIGTYNTLADAKKAGETWVSTALGERHD